MIKCIVCLNNLGTTMRVEEEQVEEGVVRHYFQCPKCETKYATHYMTDEVRESIPPGDEVEKQRLKKMQNDLKEKYGRVIKK